MSTITMAEFTETVEIALADARRAGFRTGLVFAALPVLGGLVLMCAVQVWLSEQRQDEIRHANVEAAACHTALEQHKTNDDLWRSCVGGTYAVKTEIANLVRSCR